jgi:hypothetical protein
MSHPRGIYKLNTAIMSSECKPLVMMGKRCATCALMGELMSNCDAIVRAEAQMLDLSIYPALRDMQQTKVSRLIAESWYD